MKNILIIISIMFISLNTYTSDDLFLDIERGEEIISLMDETALTIKGIVVKRNQFYYHKEIMELVDPSDINFDNLGKIKIITEIVIKPIEIFKGNMEADKMYIYLFGGDLELDGKVLHQTVSHTAYPFLDEDDVMIMGLINTSPNHILNKLIEHYSIGYHFYKGTSLQIPASKEMLSQIEEGRINKIMSKILIEMVRTLESELDEENETHINEDGKVSYVDGLPDETAMSEYVSADELMYNYELALIERDNIVNIKYSFIEYIENELRRIYE